MKEKKTEKALALAIALAIEAYSTTYALWKVLDREGLWGASDWDDSVEQSVMIADLVCETLGRNRETLGLLTSMTQFLHDLHDLQVFRELTEDSED